MSRIVVPNPDSEYAETAAEVPAGDENIAAEDGYSPLSSVAAGLGAVGGLGGLGSDDAIADVVGPGALSQSIGPVGAREAVGDGFESRVGASDARLGRLPDDHAPAFVDPVAAELLGEDERGRRPVRNSYSDPEAARLLGDIRNLDAGTQRLARYDASVDGVGYWANLYTGQVVQGEGGGDQYIGPFETFDEAQAALRDARPTNHGYDELI